MMRLSTTVNFMIPPYIYSQEACFQDIERYKALGYDGVDAIFCSAGAKDSPFRDQNWRGWAEALRQHADQKGLAFTQSHIPYYNFCMPRTTDTPEDIDDLIARCIEAAGILGARWTVAHPATPLSAALKPTVSKQLNLDYFNRQLDIAAKFGVGIAIENMADFDGGGRNRWYCAYAEELCDLVDTLSQNHNNVGICWDFGHANLVYPSQAECLRLVGDRLKVTHVHDNSGVRDEHISPFRGNADWFEIMRTLAEIGYNHDFSFEVKRIVRTDVPDTIKDSIWRHLKIVGDFLISQYETARTERGKV